LAVTITAYMTGWCSDCARSRRTLQRAGVIFAEIDIERIPGAEETMRALNGNSGKVPTILIENGTGRTVLIEPSDRELNEVLRSHHLTT
jgi:mycoredoxin